MPGRTIHIILLVPCLNSKYIYLSIYFDQNATPIPSYAKGVNLEGVES